MAEQVKRYAQRQPNSATDVVHIDKPHSVIFDFDYTLADSSVGVIECVNYAFGRLGLRLAADSAIRRTIGMSLPRTLTTLAGEEYAAHGDEFMRLFIERADEVMHDSTRLFEFVPSMADALLREDISLGIVSSKFRRRIEAILRREGLDQRFAVVIGGEDVEALKPNPSGLLRAASALGAPIDRCLYVGDSVTDAETAQRAGVPFAAVLSGVTERNAFAKYEPVTVLACAGELPAVLRCSII